jgi:hypothetical protein
MEPELVRRSVDLDGYTPIDWNDEGLLCFCQCGDHRWYRGAMVYANTFDAVEMGHLWFCCNCGAEWSGNEKLRKEAGW